MVLLMWSTTDGPRQLIGWERKLVRGAIGMMVDQLVAEGREETSQHLYHIHWFDNWDYEQRIWLVEKVAFALLTDASVPEPSAMIEATVDAVFVEISDLVEMEIADKKQDTSWRDDVTRAFESQNGRQPSIAASCDDLAEWQRVITQIADAVLGVRLYQQAESFRDGDQARTFMFLQQKGLPANFLDEIPPVVSLDEAQLCVDRIQRLVFG